MDTKRKASFALRRQPTIDGFDGRQNRLSGNDKAEEGIHPSSPLGTSGACIRCEGIFRDNPSAPGKMVKSHHGAATVSGE